MKWLCKIFGHKPDYLGAMTYESVGGDWFKRTCLCARCGQTHSKMSQF
jgi:hypothetical protein